MPLGILGVGSIAAAIVTGLSSEPSEAPEILLSPRNAARAAALAASFPRVRIAASNQAVLDGAGTVLLCLRPQDATAELARLRFAESHAVVSVIAGFPLAELRRRLGPVRELARAIPLPPVAERRSVTPVHPASPAALAIFDRLGATIAVTEESAFEGFSAASSTIAAHFATLATIAQWLAAQGVAEPAARDYVARIFADAAASLGSPEVDFEKLAAEHATPGGLNEMFRRHLTEARAFAAVDEGLDRVLARIIGA